MTSNRFHERLARQAAERAKAASTSALAEAAIAMALPVFPCLANKAPATGAGGFKNATADANAIRAAFASPSATMIGVPTGSISGWAVIDVDVKNGARGKEWLDANQRRLPRTRTHTTQSGGWHLIFRMPGHPLRTSISKLAPGIDVKADGGYIIVPPSPGYTVVPENTELADLPQWLMDALAPPEPIQAAPAPRHATEHSGTPYGLKALREECDAIVRAPFGQQETTLNTSALKIGALVTGGELEEDVAMSELLAAARSLPSQPGRTPWRPAELERKARRGFQDGKREPRSAPPMASAAPDYIDCIRPLMDNLLRKHAKEQSKPLPVLPALLDVPGVLGEFVAHCNATAISPQPFLALAAGICCIGALAGRRYRSRTDLRTNIYTISIAESGGGKDHARKRIKAALHSAGLTRYLGGEDIASGTSILTALARHPAMLFQIDEVGDWLAAVLGKQANPHKKQIAERLKTLYSSANSFITGTEYADQTRAGRPREDIQQPHACFHGTTTPGQFWAAIREGNLYDGLLARLLIFITPESFPDDQEDPLIADIPASLVEGMQSIAGGVESHQGGNLAALMSSVTASDPYTVPETPDASMAIKALRKKQLIRQRDADGTYVSSILSRTVENATKLALVRAISRRPQAPILDASDIAWAAALTEHCQTSLMQNVERYVAENEFEVWANMVREIVRKHGPVTERNLLRRGFKKVPNRARSDVLSTLIEAGYIVAHRTNHGSAGGRPTVRYSIGDETQSYGKRDDD